MEEGLLQKHNHWHQRSNTEA